MAGAALLRVPDAGPSRDPPPLPFGVVHFTINAAASQARGNADGTDVTHTLTTVTAGNNLTLNSGRDTSLIGAVASGNSATANVGRHLDLQSVQDTSTFASKGQSVGVGVSLCRPPICCRASSGSVSVNSGRVNGEFASVSTQGQGVALQI